MQWRWAWEGELSGHLGLAFPEPGRAHVTASVARPGEDVVVLDEPDAPQPRAGLEVRASGLWVDAIEEEPGDRWTIGLEAFALAVDHPDDTMGRRVPLGFDLEWERTGPAADGRVPARVHGEVLVADDVIELDSGGWWARQ